MARWGEAAWKPIGWKTTGVPAITPTAVIAHSDAGFVRSLQGWWLNPQSGSLACHLHLAWDGYAEQYVDTELRAAANMAANNFAISIECSNSPEYRDGRRSFDDDPFSGAQVDALIRVCRWLLATHPTIPGRLATDGRRGLGWHSMHADWTLPGHQCPGARRVEQLRTEIYPAVIAGQEDDEMTPTQERQLAKAADEAPKAALHAAGAHQAAKEALAEAKAGALHAAGAHAVSKEILASLQRIEALLRDR